MGPRTRLALWLGAIHLALAGVAWIAVRERPGWLLAVEVLFLVSLAASWRVVRLLTLPGRMAVTGAELLRERDFTSRFRPTGEAGVDSLVELYNEMSERLRHERLKLEEQHLFLDKLVAASPAGILILDYDGRIATANPAAVRLLGRRGDELAGLPLGSGHSGAALAGALAGLAAVPAGGSRLLAMPGGGRLKAARGEFFDQGHRREFLVLEELTGELRAGEKATYETLVRMVSHEVNNSVAAVGSLLESCRTYAGQLAADDRGDYETALAVAVGRLESLRAFIAGFAEVVRLPPPAPAPCDLERLVRDVLHLFAPELARRRIRCRRQTAGGPLPPLRLDSHQFEQVLVNVLRNAAEAIGEDGEIVVELGTEAGGRPYLAVRDSGPGVPDAVRERLFTPFFTTKKDGRGLGLTLIREVVAGHGFDLRLDNHPDGGAELKIWLTSAARAHQAMP